MELSTGKQRTTDKWSATITKIDKQADESNKLFSGTPK